MSEQGPIEHRDGVIRAVKVSPGARFIDGELRFMPVNPFIYEPTAPRSDAVCRAVKASHAPGEPVPALRCACGFWGCGSLRAVQAALGRPLRFYDVVLVVELSGRVVEHDHGWRAAHQDVVAVAFPRRCSRCGTRAGVELRAGMNAAIHPRCDGCADPASPMVELSELGVPVSWLPRTRFARRAWRAADGGPLRRW